MSWNSDLVATLAAVVDTGTFDAAAGQLHLTPSAVSQRVKTLETQVGQRLVVRSKPVHATDAGRAVLRHARRVALLEHDLDVELGLDPARGRTKVALAVNADSLATWFLDALARFVPRHDVEVELHREDQDRTAHLLADGAVAAAVTSSSSPVPGCRALPLGSLEYVPVAAPGWLERWAPDGVDDDVLARAPRVDYDRHDSLQSGWLGGRGVGPAGPRHLVPSSHDFSRAVRLGLGWGLLPTDHAQAPVDAGELVVLDGPTARTALYWQYWTADSTTLASLTEIVVEQATRSLARP